MKFKQPFLVLACFCLLSAPLLAEGEFSFEGQVTGIFSKSQSGAVTTDVVYGRYLPQMQYTGAEWFGGDGFGEGAQWDVVLAGNIYTDSLQGEIQKLDLQEHRFWFRLYDDNQELRLGLQEVSFGPAAFLRTLQWFDQKDPLDPTMFSSGVKGLLYRNYQDNDANYWLWVLGMNDTSKMLGMMTSDPEHPEFGGRAQWTFETVELGLTAHTRQVTSMIPLAPPEAETRLGLDFKHDISFSYWLEAEIVELNQIKDYNMTVGADTVLGAGEDIILMLEAHTRSRQIGVLPMEQKAAFALMLTKTDEMIDQYRGTITYAPYPESMSLQVDWQRTYDDFLWDFGVFTSSVEGLPTTYGVMLILQYNH